MQISYPRDQHSLVQVTQSSFRNAWSVHTVWQCITVVCFFFVVVVFQHFFFLLFLLFENYSHPVPISICLLMTLFLFCVIVSFCELNMVKLWDIAGRLAIICALYCSFNLLFYFKCQWHVTSKTMSPLGSLTTEEFLNMQLKFFSHAPTF